MAADTILVRFRDLSNIAAGTISNSDYEDKYQTLALDKQILVLDHLEPICRLIERVEPLWRLYLSRWHDADYVCLWRFFSSVQPSQAGTAKR